jgi:hypothetical protein
MSSFDWISNYEKESIFEVILNLVLVLHDARKGTSIEWNSFSDEDRKKYELLGKQWIKTLGLHTFPDPFSNYRIFVVNDKNISPPKTHEDISDILDFIYRRQEYFNTDINRIAISISEINTNTEVYTEICERDRINMESLNKNIEQRVDKFNDSMKKLGLKYRFGYTTRNLIPRNELLNKFVDKEYVKNHLEEYIELIENEFYSNTRFRKNPNLILEEKGFNVFQTIINMIKNGDMESLYSFVEPMSEEYRQLVKEIGILESQMFGLKD